MKTTRRLLVVFTSIMLLVGAGWHLLHSASQHTAAATYPSTAIAPDSLASARPSSTEAMRDAVKDENQEIDHGKTVVCGIGVVQLDPTDKAAPFNYVDRLTGLAQSQWRRSLLDSDDDYQRAAGLFLQSSGWDYDRISGMPSHTHDAELARDELVQLATGLNDLPIYAMAIRACDPADDAGVRSAACNQISPSKWAEMDPDNAAPWLEIAAAAHSRSDDAAELDAVGRAVQAHTVYSYNDSFLAYASAAMPSEITALQRAAFFQRWIGHVGGDGFASSFLTTTYCTAATVRNSLIHQQCEALAELFANHGHDTLDLSAAATIGTRVGWAPERVNAMREEVLATFRAEAFSGKDPWSCDNVSALTEFAGIQARLGELAAARAAIRKSGKTISELAHEQIDSLRDQVSPTRVSPASP